MLKICSGYFKTQLMGKDFAKPIRNIVINYSPVEWGQEVYEEVLGKWMDMKIPSFEPTPPPTTKIKMRSVGLKKKEMLQFTEVNRNKTLLVFLSELRNIPFLQALRAKVASLLGKVEKSKSMELKSTRHWLSELLARI